MMKLVVLVASPSAIGRMPVAMGSRVPPWPTFAASSARFTRATAVAEVSPAGLSRAIQPWIGRPLLLAIATLGRIGCGATVISILIPMRLQIAGHLGLMQ